MLGQSGLRVFVTQSILGRLKSPRMHNVELDFLTKSRDLLNSSNRSLVKYCEKKYLLNFAEFQKLKS